MPRFSIDITGKAVFALLLVLTPLLGGCVTGGLWSEVSPDHIYEPIVMGQMGKTTHAQSATPDALVVSYTLPYTWRPHSPPRLWLQLPLDASGAPAEPFCYHGKARTPAGVVADLSKGQIAEAQGATAKLAFGRGIAPSHSRYHEFADPRTEHSYQPSIENIRVFAYRVDNTGAIIPLYDDEVWPADAHIAFFPDKCARPPKDKSNATTLAVCLTPIAVVADVACIPLAILAIFTGGLC